MILHPWDRNNGFTAPDGKPTPNETALSYRRFLIYLAMGATRTVKGVCKELNLAYPTLANTSSQFNWVARAKAFDEWLSEQAAAEGNNYRQNLVRAIARQDLFPVERSLADRLVANAEAPRFRAQDSSAAPVERGSDDERGVDMNLIRRVEDAADQAERAARSQERMMLAEHRARLSDYRARTEDIGKLQTRTARNILVLVNHNLAALAESRAPIPLNILSSLASAAASLANNGHVAEGKALGVDQLLFAMGDLLGDTTIDAEVSEIKAEGD